MGASQVVVPVPASPNSARREESSAEVAAPATEAAIQRGSYCPAHCMAQLAHAPPKTQKPRGRCCGRRRRRRGLARLALDSVQTPTTRHKQIPNPVCLDLFDPNWSAKQLNKRKAIELIDAHSPWTKGPALEQSCRFAFGFSRLPARSQPCHHTDLGMILHASRDFVRRSR